VKRGSKSRPSAKSLARTAAETPESKSKRWLVVYTNQAQKDARRIAASNLRTQAEAILHILAINPFQNPPPFEKLVGDLAGAYSRRINIQHRCVYQPIKKERIVKVLRMWTHYE
jgi:toxin YoeB